MMKKLLVLGAALIWASATLAQSAPPYPFGFGAVPTPGQWAQAFQAKQDVLNYTPLNRAGGTMLGKLWVAPSSVAQAGINIAPGVAPGAPQNGDFWMTASGLFYQANGTVIGPIVPNSGNVSISGTPVSGQLAQWTNSTTIGGISLGSGVLTAAQAALNSNTGLVGLNGAITAGDCVKWSALGLQDNGSCPSSSGNVSNSGTPTNQQLAQWTNATTIQGISLGSNVLAAIEANLNASGGLASLNGAITAGDCVAWSSSGLQDNGVCPTGTVTSLTAGAGLSTSGVGSSGGSITLTGTLTG
jgi:hypothetical protein